MFIFLTENFSLYLLTTGDIANISIYNLGVKRHQLFYEENALK